MPHRLLTALVLTLPLAGWAWGSPRLAVWGGARLGGALAVAISALPRASPLAPVPADMALPGDGDAVVVVEEAPRIHHPRGEKGHTKPAVHGLYVRAATVLRLAEAGVRPTGAPVPALGARPAGLALDGVGGLGVGLRNGDVLTEVAGAPAISPGAVVGAVLAVRGRRGPAVSGLVWRGGEVWQLVVEMPYPE